jgi:hypothetical protein
MTYEEIIADNQLPKNMYDGLIFNYCLYEKELTSNLLHAIKTQLTRNGKVMIQTVHPDFLLNDGANESRWIDDAWKGLDGNFSFPHRWYARTMTDWLLLFERMGWKLLDTVETKSETGDSLSVIFVLSQGLDSVK